jgi:hypothetical protein
MTEVRLTGKIDKKKKKKTYIQIIMYNLSTMMGNDACDNPISRCIPQPHLTVLTGCGVGMRIR